jgi:hypothetical protein
MCITWDRIRMWIGIVMVQMRIRIGKQHDADLQHCYFLVYRIRDVYPGSGFFHHPPLLPPSPQPDPDPQH